jgi:putative hydrolase of the HAD superfamily
MSHKLLAICLDCGDTLADEGSEIKDDELIPGAAELVRQLSRQDYKLALVADGPTATFRNILSQHELYDYFDAFAISEELGVSKPHPRMFIHALDQLDIARKDYGRTLMVGNNLERDIKGANDLGMISVWLDWAPRRSKVPVDESEAPQYTIRLPLDLLALLKSIEGDSRGR